MSICMLLDPTDTVSDVNGYDLYGQAMVGGNGDPNGPPGYDMGTDPFDSFGCAITWDQAIADGDFSTGFDTQSQDFNLNANLRSGANALIVGGDSGNAITVPTVGDQTVGSIEIVAGAQAPGTAGWKNLFVDFYEGGQLQESVPIGQGPSVDTTDPSSNGVAEQVMTVTPASGNDDQVIVRGSFRMTAPAGVAPNPTDLFCQVFVMPPVAT